MPVKLSDEQEAILEEGRSGNRNAVVRARAGAGKTFTIERMTSVLPERDVLVCAFNRSIAEEAQRRMPAKVTVKTLHQLGCRFLFRNWDKSRLDEDRGFRLARAALGTAPAGVVKLAARLASLAKGVCPTRHTHVIVTDLAYDFDILPDDEQADSGWTVERVVKAARDAMQAALSHDGTHDYDDMVYVPVAKSWVRPSFDAVIVDEAQDMNEAQLMLARKVCRPRGRVFIVGDDRQAIYGFRGADSGAIDRMKRELNGVELKLTITRRCPAAVVAEAAKLVPDFRAAPDAPRGEVRDVTEDEMFRLARPGECFVLSRANAPLALAAMRFLREGVPCRVQGKDIGQALASLVEKVAGTRTPTMPDFIRRLGEWLGSELAKAQALEDAGRLAVADRRRDYVSDQYETLVALSDGLATTKELVARLRSLFADSGRAAVVCSTVHKAKGLEMPDVFLLEWSFRARGEEEDNIRYVALTRAKERLFRVSQSLRREHAPTGGALAEPPEPDYEFPANIVLPPEDFDALTEKILSPPAPSPALVELLRKHRDEDDDIPF
jgi:DNA helicase-2/ATP-dependent DNA helicase PcrA